MQAVAMAMLVLVHTFWLFTAVICPTGLAGSPGHAARGPNARGSPGSAPVRALL
ncbi:hypothetical protein ACFXPV_20150 [Streptomyces sp. NPDC059118]|uniref:hypothetical protein n=1 Tax=unclassified Streptomyces TaxID=2593676 RepID=UPI003678FA4E